MTLFIYTLRVARVVAPTICFLLLAGHALGSEPDEEAAENQEASVEDADLSGSWPAPALNLPLDTTEIETTEGAPKPQANDETAQGPGASTEDFEGGAAEDSSASSRLEAPTPAHTLASRTRDAWNRNRGFWRRQPGRPTPISFGLQSSTMANLRAGALKGSVALWLGYRHRPHARRVGPFVSVGMELGLSEAPLAYMPKPVITIAPTVRAGFDWVTPRFSWVPMATAHLVASYIKGPRGDLDHGFRFGVGGSFTPLAALVIPTTLEITSDVYFADGRRMSYVRAGVGWVF